MLKRLIINFTNAKKYFLNLKDQMKIVENTSGSIKTSGYVPNEFGYAQKIFKEKFITNSERI